VRVIGEGRAGSGPNAPGAVLFATTAAVLSATPVLQEEVFGSAGLIVRYDGLDELLAATEGLQGQLTATIHAVPADNDAAAALIPVLERKVGRILFNGWPTGVEVNHTMVHGGPYPATSDSRATSVGTLAIYRFQRPVSYQNMPDELLPDAVREANPWRLGRRVDGVVLQPEAALA